MSAVLKLFTPSPDIKEQLEKLCSSCIQLSSSVEILKDSINRYESHKNNKKIPITDLTNDAIRK